MQYALVTVDIKTPPGPFEESSRTNNRRSMDGYKFIIKINFRVKITIFTRFEEVKYCGVPLSPVVHKSTVWLYVGLGDFP